MTRGCYEKGWEARYETSGFFPADDPNERMIQL
jgi:hypothetical protein